MKTRLEILCVTFGWRSGTIHQAAEYLGITSARIFGMSDKEFSAMIDALRAGRYPPWRDTFEK